MLAQTPRPVQGPGLAENYLWKGRLQQSPCLAAQVQVQRSGRLVLESLGRWQKPGKDSYQSSMKQLCYSWTLTLVTASVKDVLLLEFGRDSLVTESTKRDAGEVHCESCAAGVHCDALSEANWECLVTSDLQTSFWVEKNYRSLKFNNRLHYMECCCHSW